MRAHRWVVGHRFDSLTFGTQVYVRGLIAKKLVRLDARGVIVLY
jgi:hypothetical protein